jgi:hypothetical protein
MSTRIRRTVATLSVALLATTAVVPIASAHDTRGQYRHSHPQPQKRGNDNSGLIIGLGIAALIGGAIIASQAQQHEPVYAPPPAYYPPQQPYYGSYQQPSYGYQQPAYVAQPTCTTINDIPACLDRYGNWQYVR